jgi:hypothetical protein
MEHLDDDGGNAVFAAILFQEEMLPDIHSDGDEPLAISWVKDHEGNFIIELVRGQ